MLIGIDHFIVAVPSPDDAARELEDALGLRAGAGGRHEEYGSFNRLIWLGDSYIELLGVADPALAQRAWFGPKALQVLNDTGGGYVGMSFASDDLETDVVALRAGGSRLRAPEPGERARPDGRVVRWKVATLPEADAELGHVFLIEHDSASAEWTPRERAERSKEQHPLGGAARLERVELPVPDMKSASMHAHRDIGLQFRPSLVGAGARDSSVGRQTLRLMPAGPGAMPVVVVRGGNEAGELDALGCLWRLEPAAE